METTHRKYYQYIVVGCGGVGSAAVYWLSRRAGADVLGLEQFELGHSNGGSQDHSRMIRLAYHDELYTKIAPDTFKVWREVEEESGIKLVLMTGGLWFVKKQEMGHVIDKYCQAMNANNISIPYKEDTEENPRFFGGGRGTFALYDMLGIQLANSIPKPEGSLLQLGATNEHRLISHVHTVKGMFQCRRLVVTAGAWTNHILGSLGVEIPIYVTRANIVLCHSTYKGVYQREAGIDAGGPVATAETRPYEPDPIREKACIEHLQKTVPKSLGPLMYTKTCLYTMPPDRHFVIDTYATTGWDDVIICVGAGHIFKFACLVGKILTEMAVDGQTQYDISRFNLDRDSLTDPNWKPVMFAGTGGKVPTQPSTNEKSKL